MAVCLCERTTSLGALLFYLIILIPTILNYQYPPTPPKPGSEGRGLNLTQALVDLQTITARPHAFNSRANDAVRSHILSRLEQIQSETHSLNIDNDMFSNVTFYAGDGVFRYFEGNNIVVKIEGQDPALKAVLFSAHFDSVYTSYGAADNGMGVATVLQLVSYFTKNKPFRSVMFNINNGEEDDLQGSHAFLNHPWSKDVDFFLNLEGGGVGGMPIVFRTSSYRVTQALRESSHPHGSVLCNDAFVLGLIRSRTDYTIYTAAGMSGLDFAFYQRRSYYHTLRDTISNLNGHGSLWTFMNSSLSMGIALSQIEPDWDTHSDQNPLHFDIFGRTMALFTLNHFYIANLTLLAIGIGYYVLHGVYATRPFLSPQSFAKETIYLPIITIFSVILLVGLCSTYIFMNPYIIHSSPYLVVFSFWVLAFISLHTPLSYLSEHTQNLHQTILYEINLFWWLVLLLNTVILMRQGIGALYFITFFYGTSLLALVISSLESTEVANENAGTDNHQSETTPLLGGRMERHQIPQTKHSSHWLWCLKILLCVPIPVCLMTQISIILLNALSQTLPDGTPATFVYAFFALVSFLLVLPMVPFMVAIPRKLSFFLLLLLLLISGVNLLSRPFLEGSPLKVFFYQSVNLTENTNTVHLTGLEGYIQELVQHIPSASQQPVVCKSNERGLTVCNWSSMTKINKDMVLVNTKALQPGEATVKFSGEDTRFCRIRFDNPVISFHLHDTSGEIQSQGSLPHDGIRELRLWSRERGKEFSVDVSWPKNETLRGRASCIWSDSEDWEMRNPAFQEILAFLPSWSVVSSVKEGLVEASLEFST